MLIQHIKNDAEELLHGGETYRAVAPGVFDVPDDLGRILLRFRSFWDRFDGPLPTAAPAKSARAKAAATPTAE